MSEQKQKRFKVVHLNSLAGFEDQINSEFKQGYILQSWRLDLSNTVVAVFVFDIRIQGINQ
jgi:hypothetical protein